MAKSVSIYERQRRIYVLASHRTQVGFWIDDSEVAVIDATDPNRLNVEVKAALARSKTGIPTPSLSTNHALPLLKAASLASWNTFSKGAKFVNVSEDDNVIRITPHKNLGGRGGFEPVVDKAQVVTLDEDFGQAVIDALRIAA
jgi:hypothetical protein